jgi:hypothetical protein
MWKDFNTKFSGILKNLGRHKNFVENCAQVAQYQLYQDNIADMKTASSNRFQKHQEDMVELNTKLDELVAEERRKKMNAVVQWLAVGEQSQEDHSGYQQIRSVYSSTAHWIIQHPSVEHWIEADVPSTPVLWMNGIPGAGTLHPCVGLLVLLIIGKTILASAIIDKCKEKTGFTTAFYYCHDDDQTSSLAVGVLKGVTEHLLGQNTQLLPPCYTRCTSSGEPVLRSLSQATRLLHDICAILSKTYIIIDGLDECEQVERKHIVDALMDIVGLCEKTDPGKLRVLFVSQNFADIKRALYHPSPSRPVPQTIQLSDTDNQSDINTYVRIWAGRIAEKYSPFSDDMIEYLQNLTVHNAKGSSL